MHGAAFVQLNGIVFEAGYMRVPDDSTVADDVVMELKLGDTELAFTRAEIEGRRAVRTPMQWRPGPGAGFSPADPSSFPMPLVEGEYGPDRVTDDPIEAAYFQVYLWKQAVEKAGSTEVDKIRAAVRGQEFDAPEGKVKVDDKNNHTWKPFRLGEIQKDRQFKIIYDTKEWIKPEPYTPLLYPNKGCDVTEGGEIKRS